MKFPPNWSMELLLVLALAAAVIVVVFAQSDASDRTRFTVEAKEKVQIVRELRPAFRAEETLVLGR